MTRFLSLAVLTLWTLIVVLSGIAGAQTLMCTGCVPGAAIVSDGVGPTQIDETGNYSFTTLSGKVKRNTSAVADNDCTGEQGSWWYDTTDSAFEFCNANSGAPATVGAGSGDVSDVGPGCASGACFTNGVVTTGTVLLNWEGTAADANDFTINVPANPGSTISWTVPDVAAALTFPSGTDAVVGRAATETLTNKTLSVGGTVTEGTGYINFAAVAAGACAAGEYWVQASSGTTSLSFCDNGVLRTLTDATRFLLPIYTADAVDWEWTNQPSSATFLFGSSRHVVKLDTTNYSAVRLTTNVVVAGGTTSQLELQYKTTACTVIGSYLAISGTPVVTSLTSTGVIASAWQTLSAGAKAADVCLAVIGTAGVSTGDPQLGSITAEFR